MKKFKMPAKIVLSETLFSRVNSLLILVSITVTIAAVTSVVFSFRQYDITENAFLDRKSDELRVHLDSLWDDYRKITKTLGFNVMIFPKDLNLSDFYTRNFASKYMPEEYATRLVNSGIMTMEHVAPSLIQKAYWTEKKRSVIVYGTRGEIVHGSQSAKKSPMIESVPEGAIVTGYELTKGLRLREGDSVRFLGHDFTVLSCQENKGNQDDITIWMNLEEAQKLFNKEGLINAICALECRCLSDRNLPNIAKIRKDLQRVLPQTQAVEFMSDVITRAEERYRAEVLSRETLERQKQHQITVRNNRSRTATVLIVLLATAVTILTGILTLANIKSRRYEIGLLRTLGVSTRFVLILVLSKTALLGFLGAITGVLCGWVIGYYSQISLFGSALKIDVLSFVFSAALVFVTLFVSVCAGWLPALKAAQWEPALLIQEKI
jgi:putative ABC transport system permease protein